MYYEVNYSGEGTIVISADNEDEAEYNAIEFLDEDGLDKINILNIKEVKEV